MSAIKTSEFLRDDNLSELIAKMNSLEGVIEKITAAIDRNRSAAKQLETTTNSLSGATSKGRSAIAGAAVEADKLAKARERLKFALSREGKELANVNSQIAAQNRLNKLNAQVNETQAGSYDRLRARLAQLTAQYKAMSAAQRQAADATGMGAKQIAGLKGQINDLDKAIGSGGGNIFHRLRSGFKEQFAYFFQTGLIITAVYSIINGVQQLAKTIISTNADISDSFADVQRVANMTREEVNELLDQLEQYETRTNLKTLFDFAIIGGKLGVPKEELSEFTKAVDGLNVALGGELGDNAEEVATKLAKISNVFDTPGETMAEKFEHIGNAILVLANAGVATGGYLADFANRMAGIAGISDMALSSVLGIAAGFEETGQTAETSSTALNQAVILMGKDLPNVARITGLELGKLRELYEKDIAAALLLVTSRLAGSNEGLEYMVQNFKEFGAEGRRAVAALSVMGVNAEYFAGKMGLAAGAIENIDDYLRAVELRQNSLGAAIGKVGAEFTKMATSTGVQDFLTDVFTAIKNVLIFFRESASAIGVLIKALISLGAAYVVLKSAMTGVSIAQAIGIGQTRIGIGLQNLYTAATTRAAAATALFTKALKTNPWVALASVIIGVATAFVLFTKRAKEAGDAVSNVMLEAKKQSVEAAEASKNLVKVVNDETISLDKRREAVGKLIAISAEHFSNLSLEKEHFKANMEMNDAYTASLIKRLSVQAAEARILELNAKRYDAEAKLRKQPTFNIGGRIMSLGGAGNEIVEINKELKELYSLLEIANKELKSIDQAKIDAMFEAAKNNLASIADLEDIIDRLIKERRTADPKDVPALNKSIEAYQKQLDALLGKKKDYEKENDKTLKDIQSAEIKSMEDAKDLALAKLKAETDYHNDSLTYKQERDLLYLKEEQKHERLILEKQKEFGNISANALEAALLLQGVVLQETLEGQADAMRKFILGTYAKLEADAKKEQDEALDRVKNIAKKIGDAAMKTWKEQQKKAEDERKGKKSKTFLELLFPKLTDEERGAITDSFEFAKKQLIDFFNFRAQIADRNVANADREVDAAQSALDNEIALQAAGLANKVETRRRELAESKKHQADALKEQEKAQRAQQRIQTIEQTGNLIVAASKIYQQFGLAGIPLVALMLAAFASARIQAANLAKKKFGEGDYQVMKGGSHASGDDIPLGTVSKDGRPEFAEGGEARMILPKSATSKYRTLLPEIFYALKTKTFENEFQRIGNATRDIPFSVTVAGGPSVDTGVMESSLGKLVRQGEEKTYIDAQGNLVTTYKNLKTIQYRNSSVR